MAGPTGPRATPDPSATSGPWDAIIVGAGFAGLAAAERLTAAGCQVRVLEASDRVGGRALTDYSLGNGVPLELGAQMVHGRTAVTHEWLQRYGLSARPLRLNQHSRIVLDRRVGRYPWFVLPFHPVVGTTATLDGLVRIPKALDAYMGPDLSFEAFLESRNVSNPARAIVKLLHSHSYATDPDVLGVRGPGDESRRATEPYGFRNFQVVDGYSALAQRVAARLGDRVVLNAPVTKIERTADGVRVHATAGDSKGVWELRAPAAIVTVSLAVLRSGGIEFDPPLPERMRAAIAKIGFGDAYALQMRVRNGTMRRTLGNFGVLWGGTHTSFRRPRIGTDRAGDFVTAFTVGREARRRAALSDAELIAATLAEWESVVPSGATLGTVEAFVVHRWTTDPWARGAYSFLPEGSRIEEREALARAVDDQLFFAGEATDLTGQSATVAGAIGTGVRAAEEVLAVRRAPPGKGDRR
jgi:polyamine oxidase